MLSGVVWDLRGVEEPGDPLVLAVVGGQVARQGQHLRAGGAGHFLKIVFFLFFLYLTIATDHLPAEDGRAVQVGHVPHHRPGP